MNKYTPQDLIKIIWGDPDRQGKHFSGWLDDLVTNLLFKDVPRKVHSTEEVTKRLSRLGFDRSQVAGIRDLLSKDAYKVAKYVRNRFKFHNSSEEPAPARDDFSSYSDYGNVGSNKVLTFFNRALEALFTKSLSTPDNAWLLTPTGKKQFYIESSMKKNELKQLIKLIVTEAKAYSGYKKTSDKVEHTEKIAKAKTLTPTTKPVEKKEGKKLPVKDKKSNTETSHMAPKKSTPQPPANEKQEGKKLPVGGHNNTLKEDILGMIREALEAHRVNEMAKNPFEVEAMKIDHNKVGRDKAHEILRKKFGAKYNPKLADAAIGNARLAQADDTEEDAFDERTWVNEMAKKPINYDGKTLSGSISNTLRAQDAKSPTGWSLNAPYKLKDGRTVPAGTPVDAPALTGKNYVPKGGKPAAATLPADDEEEFGVAGHPPSKVAVTLDGKKIGDFNFRLASGKISNDNMETQLYRIQDLAGHALDDSVEKKYAALEDLFFDDKLPANATLNLKTIRGPKGQTASAI